VKYNDCAIITDIVSLLIRTLEKAIDLLLLLCAAFVNDPRET